jgi:hypothetical protein
MRAPDGKILITTSEGRPCWVKGRRAIFHRWIDSARPAKARGKEDDPTAPHFQLYNVHGLVEYEDGTLRRVWPTDIQFADSAAAFGGICWEQLEHRRDALPFTFGEDPEAADPAPVERSCFTCAHEDDGMTEDCEPVSWRCSVCPITTCYCSGCDDNDKWEPKEGQGRGDNQS